MQKVPSLQPKPPKRNSIKTCSFRYEQNSGADFVAGIDEVGRGCLAGPVVAAGVVFPKNFWSSSEVLTEAIDDSKKLKAEKREELSKFICEKALAFEIAEVSENEIDRVNILQATWIAARQVVAGLVRKTKVEMIFMDGAQTIPGVSIPQRAILKGDAFSKSIAAASIVAKVYRDGRMTELSKKMPGYGFESHKGYGTSEHRQAIEKLGITSVHRRSFLKNIERLNRGKNAEGQVKEFLEERGFRILQANWKTTRCEIDLIAQKENEVRFIEVRSRSEKTDLERLFPPAKQKQFQGAVSRYLAGHPKISSDDIHLDLFCVCDRTIEPHWDVFQL